MLASTSTSGPQSSIQGALMKMARIGSGPKPRTSSSTSKLAIWRPKALRRALTSTRPRCSRSQTIIPAHVPRIGRPTSKWVRIAGSRPSRSIACAIVVLSPPGITSPSSSLSSSGVRTSIGSAPSERSTSACAKKSPWLASTPIRKGGASRGFGGTDPLLLIRCLDPALLKQLALGGKPGDVVAPHRLAELHRGRRDALGIVEVGGGFDDGASAALGILRLEDSRADEVPLSPELHHQGVVGRRRDPAGEEERHLGLSRPRGLLEKRERCS